MSPDRSLPPQPYSQETERPLAEALGEWGDGCVDPREAYDDGDGLWWRNLACAPELDATTPLPAATEVELRRIRLECRGLALSNEFAINGHENRINYIVGRGHTYHAVVRKGVAAPPEWAAAVQALVDRFLTENRWRARQAEIVRRRDRDGEVFLRCFFLPDGSTRVRFVEPAQVATPPDRATDPAASFGIQSDPWDVESVEGYYIDGQLVPAAQIQHRKAHVDANVKRGLPLFFPVRKNLRRAEKLLRNMSSVAEVQSAIALIRRHGGATRTAVQQFVTDQADATVTSPDTGRTSTFRRYGPGTVLDVYGGTEYDFPAAGLNAASYVAVLQAELRAIASRLVMPEFMLTSDASNASYASTMVAEGPAVKMFERLQAEQIEADQELFQRVLAHAASVGRIPGEALEAIELQVSAPVLAVRDRLEEEQVAEIQFRAGVLSPQSWSRARGLDYDQEQANLRAHRPQGVLPPELLRAELPRAPRRCTRK